MKGIRVIDDAIGIFDKIRNKLLKGIELCNNHISFLDNEIMGFEGKIAEDKVKISDVNYSISKANKVIKNLENIIGG